MKYLPESFSSDHWQSFIAIFRRQTATQYKQIHNRNTDTYFISNNLENPNKV